MIVECDFCDAVAHGDLDTLMDSGWARVAIASPGRVTVTACPDHHKEFLVRMDMLVASFKRTHQEGA